MNLLDFLAESQKSGYTFGINQGELVIWGREIPAWVMETGAENRSLIMQYLISCKEAYILQRKPKPPKSLHNLLREIERLEDTEVGSREAVQQRT